VSVSVIGCSSGESPAVDPDRGAAIDAATDGGADPLVEALAGKRVLWVGAHPDDESTVAPLLGEACRERGARCSFLVATRGRWQARACVQNHV